MSTVSLQRDAWVCRTSVAVTLYGGYTLHLGSSVVSVYRMRVAKLGAEWVEVRGGEGQKGLCTEMATVYAKLCMHACLYAYVWPVLVHVTSSL